MTNGIDHENAKGLTRLIPHRHAVRPQDVRTGKHHAIDKVVPERLIDAEVDKLYRDAVRYFRNLVEKDGMAPEKALSDTIVSRTLGLAQINQLVLEVQKRYGSK